MRVINLWGGSMNGNRIMLLCEYECTYLEGDCKYKNPINKYLCLGCTYSKLIKQTPLEILSKKQD